MLGIDIRCGDTRARLKNYGMPPAHLQKKGLDKLHIDSSF